MIQGVDTEENTVTYSQNPRVVIACEAIKPELEHLRQGYEKEVNTVYLPQNMHRTPHLLPDLIQEQVDKAAEYASKIILGYGLCSNGIVGVQAPDQGLVVTKSHDCVALYLGSVEKYKKISMEQPGTYYFTPSWIDGNKDPLGTLENEYIPRLGRAWAEWGAKEELKHYTYFAFINTGVGDVERFRERTWENVRYFDKKFQEIPGDQTYFQRILFGPYDREYFYLVPPWEKVQQRWYVLDTG